MLRRLLSVWLCLVFCTGCAVGQGYSNHYRASQVQHGGMAQRVTVVHVRPVVIEDDAPLSANAGIPAVLGAVVGGVLGANVIGQGNGRYVAGALAGTASAFVAQAGAKHLSRRDGLEVIVRTSDGRQVVVTQGDDQKFVPGETLYLIAVAGGLRLTR